MTNQSNHIPENMIGFNSDFDDLGQIYSPFAGVDKDYEQRTILRNFIHQHLAGSESDVIELEHSFAREFYREKDWMTDVQPIGTHG